MFARKCPVCGGDLPQPPPKGRTGRPRLVHAECGELRSRLAQVRQALERVTFHDVEHLSMMLGEVVALVDVVGNEHALIPCEEDDGERAAS
jgi:hypothetical protein